MSILSESAGSYINNYDGSIDKLLLQPQTVYSHFYCDCCGTYFPMSIQYVSLIFASEIGYVNINILFVVKLKSVLRKVETTKVMFLLLRWKV